MLFIEFSIAFGYISYYILMYVCHKVGIYAIDGIRCLSSSLVTDFRHRKKNNGFVTSQWKLLAFGVGLMAMTIISRKEGSSSLEAINSEENSSLFFFSLFSF